MAISEYIGVEASMAGKPRFNYDCPVFLQKMQEIYPQRGGSKILRDMFGISESLICNQAKRMGLVSSQRSRLKSYYEAKGSGEFDRLLKEWVPQPGGVTYLAEMLGLTTEIIRQEAGKRGLCSPKADLMRLHKESLRVNFFKEWSPIVAYYLGYIWSDGWIQCHSETRLPIGLGLNCKRDDEYIILTLRDLLGSSHSINRGVHYNPDGSVILNKDGRPREFTSVVICSSELADCLVHDHGVLPGKSDLDLPFPTNIPNGLMGHFARGCFDGDGSCGMYQYDYTKMPKRLIYFLGSNLFMHGLYRRILDLIGVSEITPQQNKKCWYLQWQNLDDIAKLYHWMYPTPDVVCLPRKRKYLEQMLAGELVPEITITNESEWESLV